jgi:hypothetical protein
MKTRPLEEKSQEHSLQFDNEVDRSWARYSYEAGYNLAQKESEEKIRLAIRHLEHHILCVNENVGSIKSALRILRGEE